MTSAALPVSCETFDGGGCRDGSAGSLSFRRFGNAAHHDGAGRTSRVKFD
jgi:hypothetical protein